MAFHRDQIVPANNQQLIVGLAGRKRSGKDTTAKKLVEELGFTRFAFADLVKEFTAKMLGLPQEAVFSDHFKDQRVFNGTTLYVGAPLALAYPTRDMKGRDLFKAVGTAARVVFGDDFWIQRLLRKIDAQYGYGHPRDGDYVHERVVVSDVRFWCEMEALESRGGVTLRLNRMDGGAHHHFASYAPDANGLCPFESRGRRCNLPRASHPTHFTEDEHASETELPDSTDSARINYPVRYAAVFNSNHADATAGAVYAWVLKMLDKTQET